METKIKSLIFICAFGLVGVLNANAASRYNSMHSARTLNEKILSFENLNSTEFVFDKDVKAVIDYEKEAQLVTKWVADREEAKTIHMLVGKLFHRSRMGTSSFAIESELSNPNSSEFIFDGGANIDYQKEAQSLTKWAADREEAKVVRNLIAEGRLAEIR